MTEEEFLHTIDGIVEHMRHDAEFNNKYSDVEIHVIGGEPTMLGLPFFTTVLPVAKKKLCEIKQEVHFSIVTNLITDESVEIACLFDQVSTSWETAHRFLKPRHEEYWQKHVNEMVDKNKKGLSWRHLSITSSITQPMVDMGAHSILDKLTGMGIKNIHFGFFIPSGDGETNKDELQPAHADTSQFYIDALDWYLRYRDDPDLWINPMESWISAVFYNHSFDDVVCPIVHGALDIDADGHTISCIERGGVMDFPSHGSIFERSRDSVDNSKVIASDASTGKFVRNIHDILTSPSYISEVVKAKRLPNFCQSCEERHLCQANCGVLHAQWDQEGECPGFKRFIKHVRYLVEEKGLRPKTEMTENSHG